MTLTEFLLARITEDEEMGRDPYLTQLPPGRWDAECKAKRRILDEVAAGRRYDIACGEGHGYNFDQIERTIALPYADHPDYREEWRP